MTPLYYVITDLDDNPVLTTPAAEVAMASDGRPSIETIRILQRMRATMEFKHGIGIAAPQVGLPLRMFIVSTKSVRGTLDTPMINPSIVYKSDSTIQSNEGCLSVPLKTCTATRHAIITVNYMDINGDQIAKVLDGIDSIAFQHEYDHLDGILISAQKSDIVVTKEKL